MPSEDSDQTVKIQRLILLLLEGTLSDIAAQYFVFYPEKMSKKNNDNNIQKKKKKKKKKRRKEDKELILLEKVCCCELTLKLPVTTIVVCFVTCL